MEPYSPVGACTFTRAANVPYCISARAPMAWRMSSSTPSNCLTAIAPLLAPSPLRFRTRLRRFLVVAAAVPVHPRHRPTFDRSQERNHRLQRVASVDGEIFPVVRPEHVHSHVVTRHGDVRQLFLLGALSQVKSHPQAHLQLVGDPLRHARTRLEPKPRPE